MHVDSRKEELGRITQSLADRLRRVCSYMTADDFDGMVRKMAEVQWRTEHRREDAFLADILRFQRDSEAR